MVTWFINYDNVIMLAVGWCTSNYSPRSPLSIDIVQCSIGFASLQCPVVHVLNVLSSGHGIEPLKLQNSILVVYSVSNNIFRNILL